MAVTLTQMRDHIETDLVDAAMQRIIDAETKRIERVVGKQTGVVERKNAAGLQTLFTRRPIASITSITERRATNYEITTSEPQ